MIAWMFSRVFHRVPATRTILDEMLSELTDLQRSPRHLYGLLNDLEPFVRAFPRLEKAGDVAIASFLRGRDVGPRRRDNVLASIVQLSRFAKMRNYLPDYRRCAAEKVKRIKAARDDVAIWTIEETRLLLDHVSEEWRVFTAIGLFAGLRTSEIFRLHWDAFEWDHLDGEGKPAAFVAVTRKVARKTRRDRIVPILPNLAAWLEPSRNRVGPLYPGGYSKANENAHSREVLRIRRATGLPRKDNANRHSFGSYRLAMTKDYAQVAFEMGNSPRKVREHYNRPRPEAEGTAFFSLRPASLENVIQLLPLQFEH